MAGHTVVYHLWTPHLAVARDWSLPCHPILIYTCFLWALNTDLAGTYLLLA